MFKTEKKLAGWHIILALSSLSIGAFFGPLQAWEHAGWNTYPAMQPYIASYYHGLTLHGILNALAFTTFFITGFLTYITATSLGRPMRYPKLSWAGFFTMVFGLILAAVPLLLNLASILYTMYPPMMAPWYFYVGMTLFVVGSWMSGWNMMITFANWRKDNPGETAPFQAFASVITMALWQICTLGIAAEMLLLIIPWSLGLVPGIDVQLARTLFWFTGHPLVYFWLLPAYISWYGMMPKQAGGKLFSGTMARFAFWLFLLLSTPIGFHHQYVDPGVPAGWKYLHAVLTYAVFFPSLLTAFNVAASLEIGGRARGGKGLLGWIKNLPWNDPSYTAQNLAMIIFIFGGAGGVINASYNVNLVIHNTAWVPGHFHLTVGTAATLSFMGIMYWLIPHLTGKAILRKAALWQAWLWAIGMLTFSRGMHWIGLLGAPRRTMLGVAIENYGTGEWRVASMMTGIGGTILLTSGLLFFYVVIHAAWFSKKDVVVEIPVAETLYEEDVPAWLNNWKPWLIAVFALIIIAYAPMIINLVTDGAAFSPGFQVWG
ncbi:MAG: cytochrome C oxidase subunit I [Anaerolineae bacterium]|jgi:cytochrome c oxidase subunit I|nr:cytochrome C oxidase subunit I [Anaerolineae bacterium]MBT7076010.1 cytochrome C oxidase subunit I [Anaerolineae bacterium]MBT7782584.1 cytochrome C oxidase subunit I [Anaerolineae bacterium]